MIDVFFLVLAYSVVIDKVRQGTLLKPAQTLTIQDSNALNDR